MKSRKSKESRGRRGSGDSSKSGGARKGKTIWKAKEVRKLGKVWKV